MKTKRSRKSLISDADRRPGRKRSKSRKRQNAKIRHKKTIGHETAETHKTNQVNAEDIRIIAEPLCEAEGMELVYAEFQREAGGRVLRLYIDKPGGVRVEDCVHVSRHIGDLLDVSFEHIGPYNLEVTSPGLDRPLGKETDFEKFSGHKAKIRYLRPQEDQGQKPDKKTIHGILAGMSEGIVKVLVDGKTVSIPFQEITRARLVPEKVES